MGTQPSPHFPAPHRAPLPACSVACQACGAWGLATEQVEVVARRELAGFWGGGSWLPACPVACRWCSRRHPFWPVWELGGRNLTSNMGRSPAALGAASHEACQGEIGLGLQTSPHTRPSHMQGLEALQEAALRTHLCGCHIPSGVSSGTIPVRRLSKLRRRHPQPDFPTRNLIQTHAGRCSHIFCGCVCPGVPRKAASVLTRLSRRAGPPWALCAVSARLSRAFAAVWGACGGPPRDHLYFPTWGGHGHMGGRAVAGACATLPAGSVHPGLLGMTPPSPGALPRGPRAVFWADVQWKTLLDSTCHREEAP